jgi:signal peptidase I
MKWLLLVAAVVGLGMVAASFGVVQISSGSMDPAFHDGDRVLAVYLKPMFRYVPVSSSRLHRRPVILFPFPSGLGDELAIKRVIGEPGDPVHLKQGTLILNGTPAREPYVSVLGDETWPRQQPAEITVPDGQAFALGDNRPGSVDARVFGCVRTAAVLGLVLSVLRKAPS